MNTIMLSIFKVAEDYLNVDVKKIIRNRMDEKKIENKKIAENTLKIGIDEMCFTFFFGYRKNLNGKIIWYEKLQEMFQLEDEKKMSTSTYGVLVIEGKLNKVNQENGKIELEKK